MNRTSFYSILGKYLSADTFLYPTRQLFQPYYFEKFLNLQGNYSKEIVEQFVKKIEQDTLAINGKSNTFGQSFQLPIFSGYLINRGCSVKNLIGAAYEIRKDKIITNARDELREIDNNLKNSGLEAANKSKKKTLEKLNKASEKLLEKFSIKNAQGIQTEKLIKIFNLIPGIPNIPEFNFEIPINIPNFKKETGFSFIYKDLTESISNFWKLGEIRDKLGSAVKIDRNAKIYSAKYEDPKYKNSSSNWKSPM